MSQLSILFHDSILYVPFRKRILEKVIAKYFLQHSKKIKNKIILEIGCGNGQGAILIQKYFSPKKIVATDVDRRLLRIAKQNIKRPDIQFEFGDSTKLKYKNNSFDAIFDFGVLHHVPNWKKALQELRRVSKPKGLVFIFDVPIESFDTLLGRIIKTLTLHPYGAMLNKKDFLDYMDKLGFSIKTKGSYQTSLRYFVLVAEK